MDYIQNIIIKNYRMGVIRLYKFTNYSFLLKRLVYIIRKIQDNIQYYFLDTESIDIGNVIKTSKLDLKKIIGDKKYESKWLNVLSKLEKLELGKNTGGITEIDQEILYKLIKGYNRKKILEIGTHIGSSTVAIAMALKSGQNKQLITVDINNVNSRNEEIWLSFESKNSPEKNLEKLNLQNYVKFVVSDSKKYMTNTKNKFDFIFLDGDHRTKSTYNDIILSINLLEKNGILVLHDYTDNNYLSSIAGPVLAVKKLRQKNNTLKIKLFKNSSLALISR